MLSPLKSLWYSMFWWWWKSLYVLYLLNRFCLRFPCCSAAAYCRKRGFSSWHASVGLTWQDRWWNEFFLEFWWNYKFSFCEKKKWDDIIELTAATITKFMHHTGFSFSSPLSSCMEKKRGWKWDWLGGKRLHYVSHLEMAMNRLEYM